MSAIIRTENLEKLYNIMTKAPIHALKGVSLEINEGEMVAIQGPSGCGKSTLLHILGCLDYPNKGKYFYKGNEVAFSNNSEIAKMRNKEIGFILQNYGLIGERTVYDNVIIPLVFANKNPKKEESRINELLDSLGILHLKDSIADNISGGERQRCAIARALVNEPSVILGDEPTGALDSENGKQCMALLREINKKGTTVIIVTHDDSVAACCDRIIRMKDGNIYSV